MSEVPHSRTYSRQAALRVVGVTERKLRQWEAQGLAQPAQTYTFHDLTALRTLAKLAEGNLRPLQLRQVLTELRRKLGVTRNPLAEVRVVATGKKLHVQVGGQRMEPLSGQLLLNFDPAELRKQLVAFPAHVRDAVVQQEQAKRLAEAQRLFEQGVQLEATGAPVEEAIDAYQQALKLDPHCSSAAVNLGTIYFNARRLRDAERFYKQALDTNPGYALAHFNLGNLYEERGDREKAQQHYEAALQVEPSYADAHYNLALLYQSTGQPMSAVSHWQTFLRLDPSSTWAEIARRELGKLRKAAVVQGKGPRTLSAEGSA